MRIALLANPDSGSGEAGDVGGLLAGLGADVVRFELDRCDEAAGCEPERIAVAGGDGSVACAAEVAGEAGVPLAVIPVGTANDFARSLELPSEVEQACRLAVEGTQTRRLDLGRMDERPFVNASSAGLSPVAARKAHGLKQALGPFAYAIGGLRAGLTAEPISCRVRCDGTERFAGKAWQVTVAITGAFGGGAEVEADPHDGVLDAVAIEARSRAWLALHAYGLRRGRIESHSAAVSCSGREILVETEGATGFNVDGELIEGECFRFTVEPHAFELVVG
jgi:diacylglycerol kinase family enzyme